MYSTLYIEQYFYGSLLSSLIIDTFWHFHNHPVKCFGHAHLNKEDKFRRKHMLMVMLMFTPGNQGVTPQ